LSPTRALVLTWTGGPEAERIYDRGDDVASLVNWGTLTFPPSRRLLCSPDVRCHPLPTIGELDAR
jgi:hypothetical protein